MQQLHNIVTWMVPHLYRIVVAVVAALGSIYLGFGGQQFNVTTGAGRSAALLALVLLIVHAVEQAGQLGGTAPKAP